MAKTIKFSEALASYNTIMKDIAERRFAPIYLLSGDEGYYEIYIYTDCGDYTGTFII